MVWCFLDVVCFFWSDVFEVFGVMFDDVVSFVYGVVLLWYVW